ncbi:YfhE family protein [Bacillus sp. HMF5848]|nr:YfhE family protein [Bacillus sp. HMF5848]RSK26139.1 YfhE family protein [Bacillus sp. HMF5848]
MAKEKRLRQKPTKSNLSSMQEVTYQHEFKMADQAAGYKGRNPRS